MTTIPNTPGREADLRARAVDRLKLSSALATSRGDASAALGVLYELAASPATAPDALTLLHELQVHQVELSLQDEELRRSRIELEASLERQIQLYDHAPVGCLVLGIDGTLRELNLTAATLLGFERESLRGRTLDGLLTTDAASTLRGMLASLTSGTGHSVADLRLRPGLDQVERCIHASACPDPGGGGFLIALSGA